MNLEINNKNSVFLKHYIVTAVDTRTDWVLDRTPTPPETFYNCCYIVCFVFIIFVWRVYLQYSMFLPLIDAQMCDTLSLLYDYC